MLQSTSRSFTRKYSLIAIMEEYISRLSVIVMQLVRILILPSITFFFWKLYPPNILRDCLLIFLTCTKWGIQWIPFFLISLTFFFHNYVLCAESVKHEIQFSKWYEKRNPIAQFALLRLSPYTFILPLFLFRARKLHFAKEKQKHFDSRAETLFLQYFYFNCAQSE